MGDPFETNFTKAQAANENHDESSRDVYSAIASLQRELQQGHPSLPANMDEAAIDAAQLDMQDRQIMEATNDERLRYSRIFRRGFKSGVKWMAGQGETLDSLIWRDEDDKLFINEFVDGNKFNMAENVIVQIRKK